MLALVRNLLDLIAGTGEWSARIRRQPTLADFYNAQRQNR